MLGETPQPRINKKAKLQVEKETVFHNTRRWLSAQCISSPYLAFLSRSQPLLRAAEISAHKSFSTRIRQPFAYSDESEIQRINRITASCSLQKLLTERNMISANTCHNLSRKLQQRSIVGCGFCNTKETKAFYYSSLAKLSEQTSLLVSRVRDKQLTIWEAHNCGYLQ